MSTWLIPYPQLQGAQPHPACAVSGSGGLGAQEDGGGQRHLSVPLFIITLPGVALWAMLRASKHAKAQLGETSGAALIASGALKLTEAWLIVPGLGPWWAVAVPFHCQPCCGHHSMGGGQSRHSLAPRSSGGSLDICGNHQQHDGQHSNSLQGFCHSVEGYSLGRFLGHDRA